MIRLKDNFFAPRQKTNRESTIPSSLRRCEETGRIEALKLQWKPGMENMPHVFWDSDVAKVMEGMALELLLNPDEKLRDRLEKIIDLFVAMQQDDGYLNSHFIQVEPENRWKDTFNQHELYCAGHIIEAAVAHFKATGSRKFLDCACRYADLIIKTFGNGPGQKRSCPGHEEIELALVKLYHASGEKKYLDLAQYFIDTRGVEPNCFLAEHPEMADPDPAKTSARLANHQAHIPVREQAEAVGHAVRAVYLYCGMADVAAETGDRELLAACEKLFDNIRQKKMHITGGIGATSIGETFCGEYFLPNDTCYDESCAAIGFALFCWRMLKLTGKEKYRETLERLVFNAALSGLSLDGDKFFYANLLEVTPYTFEHGSTRRQRQKWFDCSCCPPNFCRFIPQLGEMFFRCEADTVYLDIPVAAEIESEQYHLQISGDYPAGGRITVKAVRADNLKVICREKEFSISSGETISFEIELPVKVIHANAAVASDAGKAAIQRGPIIYALESVDNKGVELSSLLISSEPDFQLEDMEIGNIKFKAITASGWEEQIDNPDNQLYFEGESRLVPRQLKFIPYALWQNRGRSSMTVWVRKKY